MARGERNTYVEKQRHQCITSSAEVLDGYERYPGIMVARELAEASPIRSMVCF